MADAYLRHVVVNGVDYGAWEFCGDPQCSVRRHRDGGPTRFWLGKAARAILAEGGLEFCWALQQGYRKDANTDEVCWEGVLTVCQRLLQGHGYTDPVRRKVCEQILAVGKKPWPWKQRTDARVETVEAIVEVQTA